eukprot:XP_011674220.1 PREDICTED: SCO-spondin-like [Strongylocentrotus purpuratus]
MSADGLEEVEFACRKLEDVFSDCLDVVSYNKYYEICRYDLCACVLTGEEDEECQPCDTFHEFAHHCALEGVVIDWRTADFCPYSCETTMVYTEGGSPCPIVCSNLEVSTGCDPYPVPGCFCPADLYWDGEACVEKNECTCTWREFPMPIGSSVKKPCYDCYCVSAKWSCVSAPCQAECSIFGGSAYRTFDGKEYNLYTKCKYTLVKAEATVNTTAFHVTIDTTTCSSEKPSDCLGAIAIDIGEGEGAITYSITSGKEILHGGVPLDPPSTRNGVIVRRIGDLFHLSTDFGLNIEWSVETASVYISLPSDTTIKTMGLCGTLNGSPADDFKYTGSNLETVASEFGRMVSISSTLCEDKIPTSDSCTIYNTYSNIAVSRCNDLKNYPFDGCDDVDVDVYIKKCKEDVCACLGRGASEECECDSFSRYARACSRYDTVFETWRTELDKCTAVMTCTVPLQEFHECRNKCRVSCADLENEDNCIPGCVPGCFCPPKMVFDDRSQTCVLPENCPCQYNQYNERFYEAGQRRLTQCGYVQCERGQWDESQLDCSVAVCPSDKIWADCAALKTCEHVNPSKSLEICEGGCVCPEGMADFEGTCIDTQECPCYSQGVKFEHGMQTRMDCNDCLCQRDGWLCTEHACPGTCHAYGDPHYKSFDGREFAFMGDCSYVLAQDSCDDQEGTFRITVENEPCGEEGFTCTKLINMTIKARITITLLRGRDPIITPASKAKKFNVRFVGIYLFVTWKGVDGKSVELRWDLGTSIYVTVHPAYKGTLCGLCGNFDGNSENDLLMPRGNFVETSVISFAESWKVTASCPATTASEDPCVTNPSRKTWSEYSCALIKQSLFAACHNVVDPQSYYENCVMDTCACNRGDDCECLCTAITAYAKECNDQRVSIPWRASDTCGLQCEGGQVYTSCGEKCPLRCWSETQIQDDETACNDTCIEGCFCPKGTIQEEESGQCVAPSACPCIVDGKKIEAGNYFIRDCQTWYGTTYEVDFTETIQPNFVVWLNNI